MTFNCSKLYGKTMYINKWNWCILARLHVNHHLIGVKVLNNPFLNLIPNINFCKFIGEFWDYFQKSYCLFTSIWRNSWIRLKEIRSLKIYRQKTFEVVKIICNKSTETMHLFLYSNCQCKNQQLKFNLCKHQFFAQCGENFLTEQNRF